MRKPPVFGALAAALLVTTGASAQSFVPPSPQPMDEVEAAKMAPLYWSAKRSPQPYKAPNRPHWKLSEILAAHKGQADWTQPLVRNSEQEADYISLGARHKTKAKMYGDDRVVFIVQDGAIKVTIDGVAPFTATRGFMVTAPFRHFYTLETVGDKPSLRFEVRHANAAPLYPLTETPDPRPGFVYTRVTGQPGPAKITGADRTNPVYLDFWKDVANGDKANNGKFVWDDHFTSNILRGKGVPVPPATNKGHFHADFTEFWFIMEGRIGYQIEGVPYFEAEQGDVVIADTGRWHRPASAPGAPMSTRIPFNPRPTILHNFEPAD